MNSTAPQTTASPHPLAGRAMSGAEIVVQVLADEGTTAIFGYSGGAILPTYDAVFLYNQAQASGTAARRCR
jgi:acetolactate synthase-1/2/3 large subunit